MPRSKSMPKPSPAATAARIRAERERLGLTISEAARRLGVVPNTYRQFERGKNFPTLPTLSALRSLGMNLAAVAPELFGRPAAPPGKIPRSESEDS